MTTVSTTSSVTIDGLLFEWNPQGIKFAKKYVGQANVPQDVKRRRRQVYDAMRHLGSPVLVKHMLNDDDRQKGFAVRSSNYDETYGAVRHDDPVSHGIGYVSAEAADDEWVLSDGTIVKSLTQPTGATPAPKYRGFGPGFLIFMIQPDVAEDRFRLNEVGALIKVQTAEAQAPWYPEINDNDLIINVEIGKNGEILDTMERYQAKMTNPTSIRGFGDRFGRREYTEDGGNRYVVNQTFEMTLVPESDQLYRVEVDR
jgi:hypothetical protein